MRWQIEDFVFCDQQQSLTQQGASQQLEPILVALLAYFCQHPDTIISRDELVAAVWSGRTVTDSAVNRAITKLRRCFDDNPKAPRFIATFPKKGYRFIANAEKLARDAPVNQPQVATREYAQRLPKTKFLSLNRFVLVSLFALMVSLFLLLWPQLDRDNPTLLTQVKPLTRSAGQEWQPRISPDQQYLLYTEIVANHMRLFIKRLADGSTLEVNPGADSDAWVGPASWNSRGDQLVYLVATKEYCRYYRQSFAADKLGEPQHLYDCPAGSYGKVAFSHDDDVLIFTERAAEEAPYQLFTLQLSSGHKRRLNQPPLVLGGNISFDLHPTAQKLLVSAVDEQMWEGFYAVDLETDELKLLFKLDMYICCGIWDHSGKRVVLMGEHPAVQLISYDLQGQDRQVVYAGSQQLFAPERHPNGQDYVFPAGRNNLDVQFYRFNPEQTAKLANSSVDDRLAVLQPQAKYIAYVGLASGTEEIWLANRHGEQHRQLSTFGDQRHFLDLSWSPNGKMLAALTLNEIHLLAIDTGTSQLLPIPQAEIRAISFKDGQTFYFSVKQAGEWRVKGYNLNTGAVFDTDQQWQFVRFDADAANTLWLDRQNKLYAGAAAQPIEAPPVDTLNIMIGRKFNLRKQGSSWYWQGADQDGYQLYKMDIGQQSPNPIVATDSPHFDVSATGILFHRAERRDTDILQTVASIQE